LKDAANNPVALTVGGNGQTTSFSGNITDSGATTRNGSLTKIGSGVLTLTGTLSYQGSTTVSGGGILSIPNSSLNSPGATISVIGSGSTLSVKSLIADTLSISNNTGASAYDSTAVSLNGAAVPEPGAWILLALAFLSVGATRWRRSLYRDKGRLPE